ncbi:hypothetical protein N7517_003858 [Penicillium concentricum]|uniref:Uncharacterized protein n=1 Tax=Penicillium concentricum TaxID=293559 RepID=A0A9W9S549_9EURO|nr:uncharacterized protein N7517_003858 [Penicillium concentricum]KAJ5371852.1 hypothetical protein N7517_003858 [Penicillium concentricum]
MEPSVLELMEVKTLMITMTTDPGTGLSRFVRTVDRGPTQGHAAPVAIVVTKKHPGACTAFCRKCAEIGHSWRRCRLFVPHHIWARQRYGTRKTIQDVNITLPVVNPGPLVTTTSLNAAILSQLDVALSGLHRNAGIPLDSRITMNNVNIRTNMPATEQPAPIAPDTSLLDRVQRIPTRSRSIIPSRPAPKKPAFNQSPFACSPFYELASERSAPIDPDMSLLDRVQRISTEPRSIIPGRPALTNPTFNQSRFASSPFCEHVFSQPVFGQPAFTQPTFTQNKSIRVAPTRPRHGGFSFDSKY